MSSGGISVESSVTAAAEKMFFCYQCDQTVTVSISFSNIPSCPVCNGGFLEEYTDPNPNPNPDLIFPMPDQISSPFPFIPVMDFANSSFLGQSTQPHSTQEEERFDTASFIQNHLEHLQSSGINVQFLIENQNLLADLPNPLPRRNHGDYFFGRGLEDLIEQLAEDDDPNRYGTPPASKSAIDALPTVKVTKESSLQSECAVCLDKFKDGVEAKEMPCKHVYHHDCLLPWLQLHNSCPVCRHELPTDDVDYENSRVRGGETSGGDEQSLSERERYRRFVRSFPRAMRRDYVNLDSDSGSDMDTREDGLD